MKKEHRENLSFRATGQITEGHNEFGLKDFGSLGKFRSRYEFAFATYLNELNIKFEFERHGEEVRNESEIRLHYIPDFFLPEYNIYIEIVNEMSRRLAHKMYWFETQHRSKKLIVFDKKHIQAMFDSKFTIYDVLGHPRKKGRK